MAQSGAALRGSRNCNRVTPFAHLLNAMAETPDAKLDDKVKFFGREITVRQLWIATVNHLHEHLGQSIAYARSNNAVPPWSKKGG